MDGRTRPPTPEEMRVYRALLAQVDKGRRAMEAMIAGAIAAAEAERFRQAWTPQLAPVVTLDQAKQISAAVEGWNTIEQALSQLQLGRLSMVVRGADLDIVDHQSEGPPLLGAFPVVALIIIVVAIAGAITASQTITFFSEKQANTLHRDLARQAADMAKQPEPIRKAYRDMMAASPFRENKSALDRFIEGAGSSLALVAGGVLLFALLPHLSRAISSSAEKKKRLTPNPCGGDARTPDQWRVAWSRDPDKAERQLARVIDSATLKDLSGWAGWFSGYAQLDLDDEVPF